MLLFSILFTFPRLRIVDASSKVFRGNAIETMLISVNIRQFQAEAATSVYGLPCWHSFDSKPQLGYVQALTGRHAS